jgi:hypothetical protein
MIAFATMHVLHNDNNFVNSYKHTKPGNPYQTSFLGNLRVRRVVLPLYSTLGTFNYDALFFKLIQLRSISFNYKHFEDGSVLTTKLTLKTMIYLVTMQLYHNNMHNNQFQLKAF